MVSRSDSVDRIPGGRISGRLGREDRGSGVSGAVFRGSGERGSESRGSGAGGAVDRASGGLGIAGRAEGRDSVDRGSPVPRPGDGRCRVVGPDSLSDPASRSEEDS
ncbi:hypothetical protein ACWF94_31055, partial [Streptomyces sp. NPDC055078]